MRRYEILLEFLQEKTDIECEQTSEYMVFDLYLRERLKKRPEFASDQKPFETVVWKYRKENKVSKTAYIEVFRNGKAVLFDYDRRDPLSNNAHTEEIELSWC